MSGLSGYPKSDKKLDGKGASQGKHDHRALSHDGQFRHAEAPMK
jgi:hypothetical protein